MTEAGIQKQFYYNLILFFKSKQPGICEFNETSKMHFIYFFIRKKH